MQYWKLLALAVVAYALANSNVQANTEELPAPIQTLAEQGLTIVDQFPAPGGLTGYAAEFQGQAIALYLTADGEHVVVGNMLDSDGRDVAADSLYDLVTGPAMERAWAQMENATLLQDGDKDAPRVIYTMTDPNCPYCHRFREAAEPWIAAGQVQLRHLMVGIIREESRAQAAAIMGSPNPAQALQEHISRRERGGIETVARFVRIGEPIIRENHRVMQRLNLTSTPIIYFRDGNNHVQMVRGMPQPQQLEAIFGPRPR
ncbi:thiol:disulfide interchange protein DsbG [Aliidiomarina iranensis]|uniref:Thiol:disulfide interchange protein n=1 Tax=Aliidiomarina iranensis TaxID=1434071 RepID=A0A432VRQ7_9GAMM|nr:thiol:disulfide interchange protein DsbG [Aliidiomarina iranensis]RUO18998.1 thiol:disulfide interchange protein DsbG [Aliidiomarina iranensis]